MREIFSYHGPLVSNGQDEAGTSNTVHGDVSGVVIQAGAVAGGVHVHHHTTSVEVESPVGRLAQRPPWLARLRCGDDRVVGTGTLLDQRHVVTSARVEDEIVVEFPFSMGPVSGRATVAERAPSGDATVLRLAERVALTPAPLVCPPSLHGHQFWTHGFPCGQLALERVRGRLGGARGPNGAWIRIEPDGAEEWASDPGFSGAPVFAPTVGAVVGIVARDGHLLPVSYLRELWPWLEEWVGWRLDLDPSLATHWLPRARGSEVVSDNGAWYFTGRTAARRAVCDWLAEQSAPPVMVVTGGPGTGKSALLAHLLVTSDRTLAATVPVRGPRPPVGAFDAAIHATGLSRDEVAARIAVAAEVDATTPQQLIVGMRHRRRLLTLLVDAVEEADSVEEACRIATLLRDLAAAHVVRVLAGVRTAPAGSDRARILSSFGQTASRIDLESRQFLSNHDVADYVEHRLTGEESGLVRYRARLPHELRVIGRAVARKAQYNFLIAQLATRWLIHPSTPPLDLSDPAWEHGLPETIGQAMDTYLDACGPDAALVRHLLTALAFARGNGLSRDRVWLAITKAVHPAHTHTLAEMETVFQGAAHYLIERTNERGAEPSYRLFHDALDEHLREQCRVRSPHSAILAALVSSVPMRDHDRDWAAADRYILAHIADHAVQAEQLDELLDDAGFLVHGEPGRLLAALPHATTTRGQLVAAVYRTSNHRHRHVPTWARTRILALDAARLGASDLHQQLDAAQGRLVMPVGQADWRLRIATGMDASTNTVAVLGGHTGGVVAMATANLAGRPIVAAGATDGTVLVWDLIEQRRIAEIEPAGGELRVMTVAELDGRPTLLTWCKRDYNSIARLWDLTEQEEIYQFHSDDLVAFAVTEVDGRPIVITGANGDDPAVRLRDPARRSRRPGPPRGEIRQITAMTVTKLDGRPIAIIGTHWDEPLVRLVDLIDLSEIGRFSPAYEVRMLEVAQLNGTSVVVVSLGSYGGKTLQIWDLARLDRISEITMPGSVTALTVTTLDARPVVVTCDEDRMVQMWDVAEWRRLGEPFAIDRRATEIAVEVLNGRPVVIVATRDDPTLRVWDMLEQRQLGEPVTGHTNTIGSVVAAERDGRPIVVTGGWDGKMREWDLAEQREVGQVHTGHEHGVTVVPAGELNGRPVMITSDETNREKTMARVWDLAERRQIGQVGHGGRVLAVTQLAGQPIAIEAYDTSLRLWNLTAQREIGTLYASNFVNAIAVGKLDGLPLVVAIAVPARGPGSGTLRTWDLATQRPIGVMETRHAGNFGAVRVTALAVGELDDRPIVLTACKIGDPTVHVWDLAMQCQIGEIETDHNDGVSAVAVGILNGRATVFTSGGDWANRATVKVWDLKDRTCVDELAMPGPVHCLAVGPPATLVVGLGVDVAVFEAYGSAMILSSSPLFQWPSSLGRERHWWHRFVTRR